MSLPAGLAMQTPKPFTVDGVQVFLRMLDAHEATSFAKLQESDPPAPADEIMATLLGYALCDASGARLMDDAAALAELPTVPAARLAALYNAAIEHSRLTKRDDESREKNSGAAV